MRRELVFNSRIAKPHDQLHAVSTVPDNQPSRSLDGTLRPRSGQALEGGCPYASYKTYFFSFFSGFSAAGSAPSSPVSCLPFLMTSGSAATPASAATASGAATTSSLTETT